MGQYDKNRINRRTVLRWGATAAAAGPALATQGTARASAGAGSVGPFQFDEATIAQLQARMESGQLSSPRAGAGLPSAARHPDPAQGQHRHGRPLHTAAGSLALVNSRPPRDATLAARLRNAGVVILGKANLSE
jgi:amidase